MGIGYPHMATLAYGIPFSGRNLPPKLIRAFSAVSPPMATNVIQFESYGKPIDAARNTFAEQALAHNARYLFFWDEDVLMPPFALRELMFIAEHYPSYAVIGGIYALKTDRPEPLVFRGIGNGPYWDWKVGEVFDVTGIGMGCTLIRTECFKDIEKPWFKTVDNKEADLDMIPFGEQWTEDLYFCKKLIDTGKWKIAAHGGIICPHVDVNTGKEYMMTPDSKPYRDIRMPVGSKKILELGCGTSPYKTKEGKVITVDIRDDVGADYRCDFRKLPFATGEFDIIYSSNVLEHVLRHEVADVLKEWLRVMKDDGEFRVVVPDIKLAAKYILEDRQDENVKGTSGITAMDMMYGQQTYETDRHYNGFTAKSLKDLLKLMGLKHFEVEESGFEVKIRAWKNAAAAKSGDGGVRVRNVRERHRKDHK